MKQYPHVIVDIFEETMYPIVSYKFYGEVIEEARGHVKSHMKTDSFLRTAMNMRRVKDMKVKVEIAEVIGE